MCGKSWEMVKACRILIAVIAMSSRKKLEQSLFCLSSTNESVAETLALNLTMLKLFPDIVVVVSRSCSGYLRWNGSVNLSLNYTIFGSVL